jgi:hypothetical protein
VLAGLAIGGFFSVAWWWLLAPINDAASTVEIDIPPGTAAAIARGETVSLVPDRLTLTRGGSVRVINRDSVDHTIGDLVVPSGGTATIRPKSDATTLSCSAHPSGSLGLAPAVRPSLFEMVLPTFLIGLPIGAVCAFVAWVAGKLDLDDESPPDVHV